MESDLFALNYMRKLPLVNTGAGLVLTHEEGCCFLGETSLRSLSGVMSGVMFGKKDRHFTHTVFVSSHKMLKTLPAPTLLLFGLVTLCCGLKLGTFLFDLMSDGPV